MKSKKDKAKLKKQRREKKLTDASGKDRFPFYNLSQTLFKPMKWLSTTVIVLSLLAVGNATLASFPQAVNTLNQFISTIVNIIRLLLSIPQEHYAFTKFQTFLGNTLNELLTILFPITIFVIVVYLLTMLMRMHYGEEQPFKDDKLARQIKYSFVVEQLNLKQSLIDMLSSEQTNNNSKNDLQRKGENVLKHMKVEVHTRKENRGSRFYRMGVVTFEKPTDHALDKEVQRQLSEGVELLQRASNSELIFRQLNDAKQNAYFFKSVPVDLTNEYEAIIEKHQKLRNKVLGIKENEEEIKKSQYTFPLAMIKLENNNDDEKLELIERWARDKEAEIESLLVTCSTFVQKQSSEVGTASLSLVYMIGDFKKATSAHQLSDQLSNFLGIQSITVTIEAGRMTISVPIPMSMRLSMNMERIFQEAFGPDERAKEEDEEK